MNHDIGRIPIQTLCGMVCISDILPELPLPTHLLVQRPSLKEQSLLHYSNTVSIAENFLHQSFSSANDRNPDISVLLRTLASALANTDTDDIFLADHDKSAVASIHLDNEAKPASFRDNSDKNDLDICELPPIFNKALRMEAVELSKKSAFQCFVNSLGNTSWPPPKSSNSHPDVSSGQFFDAASSSKKKHKKKHKKHKKSHRMEMDMETTPVNVFTPDNPPLSNTSNSNCAKAPIIPTLKISFKHPEGPVIIPSVSKELSSPNSPPLVHNHKKKKKHKKHRHHHNHPHQQYHQHQNKTPDNQQLDAFSPESVSHISMEIHPPGGIPSVPENRIPSPITNHVISLPKDSSCLEQTDDHTKTLYLPSADVLPGESMVTISASSPFPEIDPFIHLIPMSHLEQSKERGFFDHIFPSSLQDNFPSGSEVDVELPDMQNFLNFDLPSISDINELAPLNADKDSQESHRVGSLLSVATSSRGCSEFGQGRGKPDSFQSHINSGCVVRSKETRKDRRTTTTTSDYKDSAAEYEMMKRRSKGKRRRNEVDNLTSWTLTYNKTQSDEGETETCPTEPESSQSRAIRLSNNSNSARVSRNARRVTYAPDSEDEDNKQSNEESDSDEDQPRDTSAAAATDIGQEKWMFSRNGRSLSKDINKKPKRKKSDNDDEFVVRMKEPGEAYQHLVKNQERGKSRREREIHNYGTSYQFQMDTSSFNFKSKTVWPQVFQSHIEQLLKNVNLDMNYCLPKLSALFHEAIAASSGLSSCSDLMINLDSVRMSSNALAEITHDINILKTLGIMNRIPLEKLQKLLQLLHFNIIEGTLIQSSSRKIGKHNVNSEEHDKSFHRIQLSIEAAICALNIMTSSNMPKEVFLEDIIELSLYLLREQLIFTIYPQYDPAYNLDESLKDTQSSIKSQRSKDYGRHKSNSLSRIYQRLIELVGCFADLIPALNLTDNFILQLSAISISAMYVENVIDLQLRAMRLATNIFSRYEQHRQLIMDDLVSSLHKLPTSKRNLKSFKLNSEESIQVFSGLILLFVQSVVQLPSSLTSMDQRSKKLIKNGKMVSLEENSKEELIVASSYALAMKTAYGFLYSLLFKCTQKQTELDLRNVFENFVNDLLVAVNKPEWPAAEMLLSLLGSLLVQQFNNKQLDQGIRVASISYLGTVASTLRRDAVASQLKDKDIDQVLLDLKNEISSSSTNDGDNVSSVADSMNMKSKKMSTNSIEENPATRIESLCDALIAYLRHDDRFSMIKHSRLFFLAQWLSDCEKVVENQNEKSCKDTSSQSNNGLMKCIVERKQHLFNLMVEELSDDYIRRCSSISGGGGSSGGSGGNNNSSSCTSTTATVDNNDEEGHSTTIASAGVNNKLRLLDYEEACLVCRYLSGLRPLSQSFEVYLTQICKLLNENSVAVRTKAMRCLSAVVEADPSVLGRKDIERTVHSRFLDTHISVREAAIELVGKYCISQSSLVAQYYPLLADRILDTGVSVRKRVIKIFRDICMEHPEFENVTDICVKMIRRVNDEEGIKKLVNEVFQHMWFTPVRDRDNLKILQKVVTITDVVSCGQEASNEWFLSFLKSLLNQEGSDKVRPVEKACRQIVDSLVIHILRLEEISNESNSRLVACLSTLHLFTRALPELLVQYSQTLFPYLQIKCNESIDSQIIHHTSRILEIIIPLMENPDKKFLEEVEKTLFDLMLRHGKLVLESCIACLSAVVNKCSHNHISVRQLFNRLYNGLISFRKTIEAHAERRPDPLHRPNIMRFVFMIGLLCKYFEFDSIRIDQQQQDDLFNTLMFYTVKVNDPDIRHKSLSGIGFLCIRNNQLLCGRRLREFYHAVLSTDNGSAAVDCFGGWLNNKNKSTLSSSSTTGATAASKKVLGFLEATADVKCQVMENINEFLNEDEKKIMAAETQWAERHRQESLKETDPTCSLASQVSQYYYQTVLQCFLHSDSQVRFTALSLIVTILKQGLINPVPIIPYLIGLQTDAESHIRVKADIQLQEIDKKYPCFVNIRACEGVLLSHKLQLCLNESQAIKKGSDNNDNNDGNDDHECSAAAGVVRGIRDPSAEVPMALNHHLYSLLRSNRSMRHALINNILMRFEETQLLTKAARSQAAQISIPAPPLPPMDCDPNNVPPSWISDAVGTSGELNNISAANQRSVTLGELLYLADNLAYFPYQNLEEPLFIIHRSDLIVGLAGHNILTTVRDVLFSDVLRSRKSSKSHKDHSSVNGENNSTTGTTTTGNNKSATVDRAIVICEEEITEKALMERMGFGGSADSPTGALLMTTDGRQLIEHVPLVNKRRIMFQECTEASRACFLLLMLKQFLKELYGINDARIQRFLPNQNVKQWEKAVTRRPNTHFHPKHILQLVREQYSKAEINPTDCCIPCSAQDWHKYNNLVREFLEFQRVIMALDPDSDPRNEGGDKNTKKDLSAANISTNVSAVSNTFVAPAPVTTTTTATVGGGGGGSGNGNGGSAIMSGANSFVEKNEIKSSKSRHHHHAPKMDSFEESLASMAALSEKKYKSSSSSHHKRQRDNKSGEKRSHKRTLPPEDDTHDDAPARNKRRVKKIVQYRISSSDEDNNGAL